MSARVERKYGGFTPAQLRAMAAAHKGREDARILLDLLDELDALQADEMLPRLRRIETKIHRVAVQVGAEPADSTTMTISVQEMPTHVNVGVTGYDVTLAQIRRALEDHGVDLRRRMIHVCTGGQGSGCIATLYLTPQD